MLFKSNLLAQASGSLAGTTFSHNRFGMYTRNRSIPVNPSSAYQQQIRSILTYASGAWNNALSGAERAQWDTFAAAVPVINKLGDSVYLTGFNWWVGSCTNRLQGGLTPVQPGPAILSRPDTDATFAVAASEATQNITITFDDTRDWCDENGSGMVIFAGTPTNPNRTFFGGPFRRAGTILGNSVTPPTSTQTVTCPFVFQAGQQIWVRARILKDDGRFTSFFKASAEAGA